MFNKNMVAILVVALVLVAGFAYFGLKDESQSQTMADDPAAIVYYWGDGCPHCKVVSDFLEANNVTDTVSFEKKEVWSDKQNANEMSRRAKACDIEPEGMGVPFLYGGDGKCYVGQVDVVNFFKTKIGMSMEASVETQK